MYFEIIAIYSWHNLEVIQNFVNAVCTLHLAYLQMHDVKLCKWNHTVVSQANINKIDHFNLKLVPGLSLCTNRWRKKRAIPDHLPLQPARICQGKKLKSPIKYEQDCMLGLSSASFCIPVPFLIICSLGSVRSICAV